MRKGGRHDGRERLLLEVIVLDALVAAMIVLAAVATTPNAITDSTTNVLSRPQ